MAAQVGVALVVEGLAIFASKMGQAGSIIESLRPKATLVERAFKSLGNTLKSFANGAIRVLQYALGNLIAHGIREVISWLGELGNAIIEQGDFFQRLQIRLNRFNMNELKDSGMAANKVLEETVRLTKEQLNWAIDLAGLTVFNTQDIAGAYGLARGYGFADEAARGLTERILEFSSGMALPSNAIERIITNMGQMVQQGKITGTELRDLARGSFVPVNKILNIIADTMGITTEELNKMRKAGTTDPQWFIQAFGLMVGEDFSGATEDMAKTFTGAMDNVRDIFVSRLSMMVVSPVFDKLGERISSITQAFYKGKSIKPEFAKAIERISESLQRIIDKIFNLLPGANSIADTIIKMFSNIATWLEANEDNIANWVKNAIDFLKQVGETIKNDVIPWIRDELIPAIIKFGEWFSKNKETIWTVLKIIVGAFLLWQATMMATRFELGLLVVAIKLILNITGALVAAIIFVIQAITFLPATTVAAFAVVKMEIDGLVNKFNETAESIKQRIRETIDKVIYFFQSTDWGQLGRNLVIGIANGIVSAAGVVYSAIINLANNIISILNSFFQMKSPSKLMAKSGMNIMAGLSKGMAKGASEAVKVAGATASAIAGTLSGSGAPKSITSGIASKAAGATSGTGSLVKNYLGPTGDVMRSKLDQTTGDPCAKNSTAKCVGDAIGKAIGSAVGGIGSGILNAVDKVANEVTEAIKTMKEGAKNFADEDLKRFSNLYRTGVDEIKQFVDDATQASKTNSYYATEDLKRFSASALTSFKGSSKDIAGAAGTSLTEIANVFGMYARALYADYSSAVSASKEMSKVPVSSSTSNTTIVTNNFKEMSKGQRVTFDYENSQFWV